MKSESVTNLENIVVGHIPSEVLRAHEARSIIRAIGDSHHHFSNSEYRHIFGVLQYQALGQLILSLCNLYEKPDYPNFSIPTALAKLRASLSDLPLDTARLQQAISTQVGLTRMQSRTVSEVAVVLLDHFEEQRPRIPARQGKDLDRIYHALRTQRDKRVAHVEDCDLSGKPTTDLPDTVKLLLFAIDFVNTVGFGMLNLSSQIIQAETVLGSSKGGKQMAEVIARVLKGQDQTT